MLKFENASFFIGGSETKCREKMHSNSRFDKHIWPDIKYSCRARCWNSSDEHPTLLRQRDFDAYNGEAPKRSNIWMVVDDGINLVHNSKRPFYHWVRLHLNSLPFHSISFPYFPLFTIKLRYYVLQRIFGRKFLVMSFGFLTQNLFCHMDHKTFHIYAKK